MPPAQGPLERRRDIYFAVLLFVPRLCVMTIVEIIAFVACYIAGTGASSSRPLIAWRRSLVAIWPPRAGRGRACVVVTGVRAWAVESL